MKLKQAYYDKLAAHKAKVAEARTAAEAGELDRAEELTKEAQSLAGEIEKLKALIAEEERYAPPRGSGPTDGKEHGKGFRLQQEGEGEDGYAQAVKRSEEHTSELQSQR